MIVMIVRMIVMIDFDVCLFLLYVFLYYLWNLFVFVGKNIEIHCMSSSVNVHYNLHYNFFIIIFLQVFIKSSNQE